MKSILSISVNLLIAIFEQLRCGYYLIKTFFFDLSDFFLLIPLNKCLHQMFNKSMDILSIVISFITCTKGNLSHRKIRLKTTASESNYSHVL